MQKKTIKEIESILAEISDEQDQCFKELQSDERKGVQNLVHKWQRMRQKEQAEMVRYEQLSVYEKEYWLKGKKRIAGIDEVGRGPLAGPVISAAVILKEGTIIKGLNDSKKMNQTKREQLYHEIFEKAEAISIGVVDAQEIDQINIYEATKKSMLLAVKKLDIQPDILFIDAMKLNSPYEELSLIKGDAHSISIAAASIIAKVTRDRMMTEYDAQFPQYGFAQNMGYGTKIHLEAINEIGPCQIHRKSFAPINKK